MVAETSLSSQPSCPPPRNQAFTNWVETRTMTNDLSQFPFGGDVAPLLKEWLATLKAERRLAAKTLEAYTRDIVQFGAFLQDHLGEPATAKALTELDASDFRAFMARLRNNAIESRSLARKLSAIRSFFRHAERNGHFKCAAMSVVRAPKISHSVPRPLSEQQSSRLVEIYIVRPTIKRSESLVSSITATTSVSSTISSCTMPCHTNH